METKRWTISNLLSISRIILVAPIAYFLLSKEIPYHREYAILFILLAMITDILDGYFARRFQEISELGKILDPLADKIGVGLVVIILTISGDIPLWFMIAILARDGIIFLGGIYLKKKKGIIPASAMPGKIAVVASSITLVLAILHLKTLQEIFLWSSVLLMLYSFIDYTQRFFSHLKK